MKANRILSAALAAVLLSGVAFAATTNVTEVAEAYKKTVHNAGYGVRAVTPKATEWPDDMPTPAFWFDCTQTNGWTFVTENGTNCVTCIPSLVGDRTLSTNRFATGTAWPGWGGKKNLNPPMYLVDPELPGGAYLDFGNFGSYRALLFDPHSYAALGDDKHCLANIGSVLAIWGSQNGGGYILGGGNIDGTGCSDQENYRWTRGWDNVKATNSGTVYFWSTVLGAYSSTTKNAPGYYMHDGQLGNGDSLGLNGGWETIGLSFDEAKWTASGLGIGDARSGYGRCGGCRIAEIMIFDWTLTKEQMYAAQQFLSRKWLNKDFRGQNGDAHLGELYLHESDWTFTSEVNTPANETLTVDRLRGGRAGGDYGPTAVVKTGDGTLKVGDASRFTAPIRVRGGTLSLTRRTVPKTAAELPRDLYLRFDVSERSSVTVSTEDGVDYVDAIADLAGGRINNKSVFLRARTAAEENLTFKSGVVDPYDLRPWLSYYPFGPAKPIVDCGVRNDVGKFLCFYKGDSAATATNRVSLSACSTIVAFQNLERGGGHLGDTTYWTRDNRWVGSYSGQILKTAAAGTSAIPVATNSAIFVNGVKVLPTSGYEHSGMNIVAIRNVGGSTSTIGAEQYYSGVVEQSAHGGTMFGEILYWNRPLSDEELQDAQAYLARKWLGETMPGYANVESEDIPDCQMVVVEGESTIDVPAGETVCIRDLQVRAPTVKTGAGTLEVGTGSDLKLLTVREGEVRTVRTTPTVSGQCEVAKGATLHLDANATNSFMTTEIDGVRYVDRWHSLVTDDFATQGTAANRPWINDSPEALLNGMPVVDFGAFNAGRKAYMELNRHHVSTRSVFLVRGSQENGGCLLGENYNGTLRNCIDFYRDCGYGLDKPIVGTHASAMVREGDFYLDGVKTNCTTALPTGGYELIDLHMKGGALVSALACQRGSTGSACGGQRIAELLIYERPLSAREIVATRNYLTRKWFPGRPLEALPEEEPVEPASIASLMVDEETPFEADEDFAVETLSGEGTLVKSGAATLSVRDVSAYEGAIDVSEGGLAITGRPTDGTGALKTEGRLVHFDANYGVQTVTNEDASITVTNWVPVVGARHAVPRFYGGTTSTAGYLPWELNGHPAVDMPSNVSLWFKDGEDNYACVSNIGSVFWVIGSKRGGGFVLGGGTQDPNESNMQISYYTFHRGTPNQGLGAGHHTDAICNGSGLAYTTQGKWRLNGEDVANSHGLSGDWDVMSFRVKNEDSFIPGVAGFAFDGRAYRYGCQALAEVIIYDHILTDEETSAVEEYLAAKWGFKQANAVNDMKVALAAGTTLEVNDGQYIDSLTGDGAVDGDVTVRAFAAAYGQSGLTVTGTLTVAENPVITLTDVPSALSSTVDIPLASATAIGGRENFASATFNGVPVGIKAKLIDLNGVLSVRLRSMGMLIFVR